MLFFMKKFSINYKSNKNITYSCKYHIIFCPKYRRKVLLCSKIPTLWTNSYFVSTLGGAPMQIIKQYIEGQKNV